jgi:hypothetical protein
MGSDFDEPRIHDREPGADPVEADEGGDADQIGRGEPAAPR